MSVSIALLAAHMVGDFILKTDDMAGRTRDEAWPRLKHVTVHFVTAAIALMPIVAVETATLAAAAVMALHFIVDSLPLPEPKDDFEAYPMAVDQTLHVSSLAIVAVLYL